MAIDHNGPTTTTQVASILRTDDNHATAQRVIDHQGRRRVLTIDHKEYIGSVLDIMVQSEYNQISTQFPCYLSMNNITSNVEWLRKSNHSPNEVPIHNKLQGTTQDT